MMFPRKFFDCCQPQLLKAFQYCSLSILLFIIFPIPRTNCAVGPFKYIDENCHPKANDGSGGRLTGGIDVSSSEVYPFMVSLQLPHSHDNQSYFEHFCGGTLISKGVVLTAAHCLWEGDWDKRSTGIIEGQLAQEISVAISPHCRHQIGYSRLQVETYYIHENYQGSIAEGSSDIAILKLKGDLNYDTTYPSYEDSDEYFQSDDLVIIGWGNMNKDEARDIKLFRATVEPLQQGHVQLRTDSTCASETHFCAAGVSEETGELLDACKGDSGGPVLVINGNKIVQVGITSFGYGFHDCIGETLGAYTDVRQFVPWIDGILQRINGEPSTSSQVLCTPYSTNGLGQLSTNEGINVPAPSGSAFLKVQDAQQCAEACETQNSQCQDSACCDSFTYNPAKQECWLKSGSSRSTNSNQYSWQTFWRDTGASSATVQVCGGSSTSGGQGHVYLTNGPGQLSVNEGSSVQTSSGQAYLSVSSAADCALQCEAISLCKSFSFNPYQNRCYLKQGQTFNTQYSSSGWQSYWQLSGDTVQSECTQFGSSCIYCEDTCRDY